MNVEDIVVDEAVVELYDCKVTPIFELPQVLYSARRFCKQIRIKFCTFLGAMVQIIFFLVINAMLTSNKKQCAQNITSQTTIEKQET